MSRLSALVAVLAVALVLAGGCQRHDAGPSTVVDLDGSARIPDVEGVVRAVDRRHLELEGGKVYPISPNLQSFNSSTRSAISVLQRKGEYVQLGLRDGTVVWVAAIGAVVPLDRPTVFYQGTVVRTSGGRVVFKDGTALRIAPGVTAPKGALVRAELDPRSRRVEVLAVI